MRVLLDTHTLIWWLADDRRLSRRARALIGRADSTVLVSSVSAWEMSIKLQLRRLEDPDGALSRFPALLVERGMTELPISSTHAILAGQLPRVHRDPFDRMLVAQSRLEELPLITDDPVFRKYEAQVIW